MDGFISRSGIISRKKSENTVKIPHFLKSMDNEIIRNEGSHLQENFQLTFHHHHPGEGKRGENTSPMFVE